MREEGTRKRAWEKEREKESERGRENERVKPGRKSEKETCTLRELESADQSVLLHRSYDLAL